MRAALAEKTVMDIAPARYHNTPVDNKIFLMQAAHYGPGSQNINGGEYAEGDIAVRSKTAEQIAALGAFEAAKAICQYIYLYTSFGGAVQKCRHDPAAFVVAEIEGREYDLFFGVFNGPQPQVKCLAVVGDEAHTVTR